MIRLLSFYKPPMLFIEKVRSLGRSLGHSSMTVALFAARNGSELFVTFICGLSNKLCGMLHRSPFSLSILAFSIFLLIKRCF